MATAGAVARGAVWNYSAQIVTVLVQFGYAAITSRLLAPHEFGAYAAGYASAQLINLIGLAGLQQVVGRMTELVPSRLAGLLSYSAAVGVAAAALTYFSAPVWATIWGVPDSVGPLRVLAGMSFLTPLVALGNGLNLRLGTFRRLAMRTVVANAVGMALGVVCVLSLRSAESLAIAPVLSQLGVAALLLWSCRAHFRGRPDWRALLEDVRYSGKSLVSALLTYSSSTIGRLTVSQSIGTVPLGNWNRADAITSNPFWTLGAAMASALFPEFRHDIGDRSRAHRVWSDLLGILGWVCVPLGVLVSVLAPVLVHVLLGDGWELAAGYASALAILGAVQPVAFLLVSGFEAIGRFSWIWGGYIAAFISNVAAALAALGTRDVWPVFAGTLVGYTLLHVLHLRRAHREGLVDLRRVLTHYGQIAAFCLPLAAVLFVLVHWGLVASVSPLLPVAVLVAAAGGAALVLRHPTRFPPLRLAHTYGLLGGTRNREPVTAR